MSSRSAKEKAIAVIQRGEAPLPASKLPEVLRFPLLVVLSLTLSSLLYSFAAPFTGRELASVSRRLDGWAEVGGLVAWRGIELAIGWWGGYDGYDLAALSLLSHGPPIYLLTTFYAISPSTAISSLVIDSLATYIPFRLLRPLSLAHAASTSTGSVVVPNRDIVTDLSVQTLTTILAASIYSVTLYSAYVTYLPLSLVTYFEDIPSIVAAHTSTPISLLPLSLLLGLAARSFIFTPAATTLSIERKVFDPASATFEETFWYNVWGYNTKAKTVIKRTAVLCAVSGVNTFLQTWVTIEGVESKGAAAWSSVWVASAAITGAALGLVGAV